MEETLDSGFPRDDDPSWRLREVTRASAHLNVALARRLGVGATDLEALDHLLSDGPLGPAELGERLGLRSASATALVDRLERAGHVERQRHPSDRRRLSVVPTPHAVAEAWRAILPAIRDVAAVADGLSDEERRVVSRYLADVAEVLRGHARARP